MKAAKPPRYPVPFLIGFLFQVYKAVLAPWEPNCTLYTMLVESDISAIHVIFPWTDHTFDLLFPPQISPTAQSTLNDVDRFLAILANNKGRKGDK
jgi:hypothetical protein